MCIIKKRLRAICAAHIAAGFQSKSNVWPAGERVQARIVKAPCNAGDVRWRQEFDRKVRTHHAIYELSESFFVTVFVMFWF